LDAGISGGAARAIEEVAGLSFRKTLGVLCALA